MDEPAPCRSTRANRSLNGRDAQLDRLGDQLIALTCPKKRQFVPEDGLVIEVNKLAPVPKKCRGKVWSDALNSCCPTNHSTEKESSHST